MLDNLTKDVWESYLGHDFQLDYGNGESMKISLSAVSGYGKIMSRNREAFSLIFLGPMTPILPQKIYRLSTVGLTDLEVFLVPIGPQAEGMCYEAVFT